MNAPAALLAVRDPLLRHQLRNAVVRAGFATTDVGSADLALAEATRQRPQLVVVEGALGGGAGAEFVRALRALPDAKLIPVLVLSEARAGVAPELALADDATDFFSKPVNLDRFELRVRFLARALVTQRELEGARDELAEQLHALERAHLHAGLGVWECDPAANEVALTHEALHVFGLDAAPASLAELVERTVHPDDRAKLLDALGALAAGVPGAAFEHRAAGALRWLRHHPVRATARRASELPLGLLAQDVTPQRVAEDRIRRIAMYDPVTGLPGRAIFESRLERALQRFAGKENRVALLWLDVDGIHAVRDRHGDAGADEVLRAVANRLVLSLRSGDAVSRIEGNPPGVARLGGDQFAVVLAGIGRMEDAATCAKRLAEVLAAPLEVAGLPRAATLEPRIGIAVAPRDGATVAELIASVQRAGLAAAKSGSRYRFPDGTRNAREDRAATIVADLPNVAERGELSVLYQPRVELADGRISGAEALVRWRHPRLGEIPPKDFIGIAERDGLIDSIGTWVLASASAYAGAWPGGRISVNVSRSQLLSGDFARVVFRALIAANLRPEQLELEVTESLMYENESCLEPLRELAAVGVTLALDDFGSGYSSLSTLVRFPVQVIKIDRSIVKDVDENPDALRVVRGVVRVGHDLGMRVVAEGVDRASQVPLLIDAACDEAQGFLISKPLPGADLQALLASWGPRAAEFAAPSRDREPGI
jgi:diguanylate cyclase (GGDEF)-like protein